MSKALIHKAGAFALIADLFFDGVWYAADDTGGVGVFGERLQLEGTSPTNTPGERAEYITPPSN